MARRAEEQIVRVLNEYKSGAKTVEVCRRLGGSTNTFYRWKSRPAGTELTEMRRLRQLEDENRRLKQLAADPRWTSRPSSRRANVGRRV